MRGAEGRKRRYGGSDGVRVSYFRTPYLRTAFLLTLSIRSMDTDLRIPLRAAAVAAMVALRRGVRRRGGRARAGGAAGGRRAGGPGVTLAATDLASPQRTALEDAIAVTGNLEPLERAEVRARLEGDVEGVLRPRGRGRARRAAAGALRRGRPGRQRPQRRRRRGRRAQRAGARPSGRWSRTASCTARAPSPSATCAWPSRPSPRRAPGWPPRRRAPAAAAAR